MYGSWETPQMQQIDKKNIVFALLEIWFPPSSVARRVTSQTEKKKKDPVTNFNILLF